MMDSDDDDGEACREFCRKTCPSQERENDDRGRGSKTEEDPEEDRGYRTGVWVMANLCQSFRNHI